MTVASLRPRSSPALNVQEYASGRLLPASLICSVLGHARKTAAALLVAWAATAAAQPIDPEGQGAAMAQTVLDQLAAFRRGDWGTAYAFASAAIQGQFPPEAFREMVTRGYAPIARSVRGTVLRTEALDSRHGFVEIRVEGQHGQTLDALYELVEEQGAWRINGVLTKPVERGTTAGRSPVSLSGARDGRAPTLSHPWPFRLLGTPRGGVRPGRGLLLLPETLLR